MANGGTTMTEPRELPRLGPEDDDHRAACGYSLRPGAPRCTNPAQVHLMVRRERDGYECVLATCLHHFEIAKAAATVIDRHAHRGVCGLPGTVWSLDLLRCVIDDSGQEPAPAVSAALPMAKEPAHV